MITGKPANDKPQSRTLIRAEGDTLGDVSNVLNEEKKQQVIAFGRLGWSLRRIQRETGVRREPAAAYLKAAGIAFRPPGGWGRQPPAKPANEVITDSTAAKPASEATTEFGAELAASTTAVPEPQ